jgi:hypothetical protein
MVAPTAPVVALLALSLGRDQGGLRSGRNHRDHQEAMAVKRLAIEFGAAALFCFLVGMICWAVLK